MKRFIAFGLVLVFGCSVSYVQWEEIPSESDKLAEYVKKLEVDVQQKESELTVARESRDLVARAAENAVGWADRDSAMTKLARANKEVERANWWLWQYKSRLSHVKEKTRE